MGDLESRVVGAGVPFIVNGREFNLRPLTLRGLQQLQQEALRSYRQSYLRTYRDSIEDLGVPPDMLDRKMDEAARWTVADLPKMAAYSAAGCPVTDDLRSLVDGQVGAKQRTDDQVRMVITSLLDQGRIKLDDVVAACGVEPARGYVNYDAWWITGCFEGMTAMVHASIGDQGVTRQDIGNWSVDTLSQMSRVIETLTAPAVGNS